MSQFLLCYLLKFLTTFFHFPEFLVVDGDNGVSAFRVDHRNKGLLYSLTTIRGERGNRETYES
jgi:hypothetical protein